jgi:hypothetical protein
MNKTAWNGACLLRANTKACLILSGREREAHVQKMSTRCMSSSSAPCAGAGRLAETELFSY